LLKKIVSGGLLRANGVVGLFPASAERDDITMYDVDGGEEIGVLHGLRQQAELDHGDGKYHCISDFVAPKSSNLRDYVGMFAVTAGLGCKELCDRFVV
jgi:5-methyltetrahydrofolate--homocysteine methyltransferase